MAAEVNHLRCPYEAKEYLDNDGQQRLADGQLDAEGAAQTRCAEVTEDISGTKSM